MNNRLLSSLTIAMMAVAVALTPAAAQAQDGADTEDIVLMNDGRELHGHIVSESATEIVFEFVDRAIGLRTTLRLDPAKVAHVRKDVPLKDAPEAKPARTTSPPRAGATSRPAAGTAEESAPRFGKSRHDTDSHLVTTIYRVPMRGQMGTDIHKDVYEKVVADILSAKPDLIVFELDSSEFPDLMIPEIQDPRDSRGILALDEYRELVSMLKNELPRAQRQVMWVHDAVGFSSMLALAWDEVYMAPDARFWGLRSVVDRTGADKWSDPDVRAKMQAAVGGSVKSFLEYGGYGMELADAMLWPEKVLSATFHGREVVFALNTDGEIVVDNSDKATLALRAKDAEDLLLSDGTVESLDDLTFLLGFREYREVGSGQKIVQDYVDAWHKAYDQSKALMDDYFQHTRWASGEDTVKYLGQAKSDLQKIIRAMEQYPAVEIRWQEDAGVTKFSLEIEVEKLTEQLRALKSRRGGNYGSGGGGFGSGGGGG